MFPEEIWGVELLGVILGLAVSPSARWYRPFVWCHPSCWAPLHAACILAWRLKCVWDEQKLATCREITMKYWIHDDKDSIMKSKQDLMDGFEHSAGVMIPVATKGNKHKLGRHRFCCVTFWCGQMIDKFDMSAVVIVGCSNQCLTVAESCSGTAEATNFHSWMIIWFSQVILLMVQKSQGQPPFGCFWNPVNNERFTQTQLVSEWVFFFRISGWTIQP